MVGTEPAMPIFKNVELMGVVKEIFLRISAPHNKEFHNMISVCMATFNGAKYVVEQCTSILDELGECDELIIQDDASSDDTVAKILDIKDPRIFLEVNKSNLGYVLNFEKVLSKARGELIFLADQDDIWTKGKVASCVEDLDIYDVVISNALVVGDARDPGKEYFTQKFVRSNQYIKRLICFFRPRYLGSCMAFRKTALDFMLPFPKQINFVPHDFWLGTYSILFLNVKFNSDCLVLYRRHDLNVSNGGQGKGLKLHKKIKYRAYTLFFAFRRFISRSF